MTEENAYPVSPPPYLIQILKSIPGFHRMDVLNLKDKKNVLSVHSGLLKEERVEDVQLLTQAVLEFVKEVTHEDSLEEAHWVDDVAAYFFIPAPKESWMIFFVFRQEEFDLKIARHTIRQYLPTLFSHLRSTPA